MVRGVVRRVAFHCHGLNVTHMFKVSDQVCGKYVPLNEVQYLIVFLKGNQGCERHSLQYNYMNCTAVSVAVYTTHIGGEMFKNAAALCVEDAESLGKVVPLHGSHQLLVRCNTKRRHSLPPTYLPLAGNLQNCTVKLASNSATTDNGEC